MDFDDLHGRLGIRLEYNPEDYSDGASIRVVLTLDGLELDSDSISLPISRDSG